MGVALFLIFIVLPFVELWAIIQVAGVIGGGWTILLLVAESIFGAWLCKREGSGVLRRINDELQAGRMPTVEVVNGALILLAGALMITPGFITDILGFVLLVPPTRAVVRAMLAKRLQRRIERSMSEGADASFRVIRVTNFGTHGAPSGFDGGFGDPFRGGTVMDVSSRDITANHAADRARLGDGESAA